MNKIKRDTRIFPNCLCGSSMIHEEFESPNILFYCPACKSSMLLHEKVRFSNDMVAQILGVFSYSDNTLANVEVSWSMDTDSGTKLKVKQI